MNILKKALGSLLRSAGYQAVPVQLVQGLGLVLHLKRVLVRYQVDAVFDVGANRGQFYDLLRRDAEFDGHILSFEPIPELAKALTTRSRLDSKWHVYPIALGAVDEQRWLNVMGLDILSSFLEPSGNAPELYRKAIQPHRRESVTVRQLDGQFEAICSEYGIERPYLKLDTQGYDLNVLQGAAASLSRFVALQTEASVLPIYKNMPRWEDVLAHLYGKGYELSGLFPVANDWQMRLVEFDCVMVNAAHAKRLAAGTGGRRATDRPELLI